MDARSLSFHPPGALFPAQLRAQNTQMLGRKARIHPEFALSLKTSKSQRRHLNPVALGDPFIPEAPPAPSPLPWAAARAWMEAPGSQSRLQTPE